jgi:hypothetical protein
MSDNGTERFNEESGKKTGFFKRLWRFIRNTLILAMILVPCGYAAKLQLKIKDKSYLADSLRNALSESYARLDSLKILMDNEALLKDSLDDIVDKKLDEGLTKAMIMIDTTMDWLTARKAVEENIALDNWIDTLCARYPDGVASHVKLHYLKERDQRLERLNYRLSTKFPEHAADGGE